MYPQSNIIFTIYFSSHVSEREFQGKPPLTSVRTDKQFKSHFQWQS